MSGNQFLPPEIIFTHILTKVPPESLLRFKAVSKSWQSEINDPDFTNRYQTQTLVFIDERQHQFGVVEGVRTQTPTVRKFPIAPFPSKRSFEQRVKIIGCCNGLVAVQEEPSCEVAVWNPYLRNYQKVPGSSYDKVPGIHLGFGYDSSHDDYKIVRIQSGIFWVFSLRTNSWGPFKDLASELRFELFISSGRDNSVTVGDTLHWTAAKRFGPHRSKELVVVAFDLSAEKCRGVALPDYGSGPARVTLANLHGRLCVIRDHECCFDVWVMLEYGVNASWTLAHRAMLPSVLTSASLTFRLLVFPEDGVRVLLEFDGVCGNKYVWFDMTNSSFEEVPALDVPVVSEACASMRSLVQTHWVSRKTRQDSVFSFICSNRNIIAEESGNKIQQKKVKRIAFSGNLGGKIMCEWKLFMSVFWFW